MLLHYPPPDPRDCIKENACKECVFFQHCREIELTRHKNSSKSLSEIESIARQNSLGALQWEDYSPED